MTITITSDDGKVELRLVAKKTRASLIVEGEHEDVLQLLDDLIEVTDKLEDESFHLL